MKYIISLLALIHLMSNGMAQSNKPMLRPNDLKNLVGTWTGQLTYLDYTSGKPFSMPANVEIASIGDGLQYRIYYTYPDEPKANGADTLAITAGGRVLDGDSIVSVNSLQNGIVEVITERLGKDGNDHKPALLRYIYLIGDRSFIKRKEVRFVGTENWLLRNEYAFKR